MRPFSKTIIATTVFLSLGAVSVAFAKPIKNKYSTVENGKMSAQTRNELANEVVWSKQQMNQEQYQAVVADPQMARNDYERLAGLSAREIFILVDRSGSMGASDENPTGVVSGRWTRWDSARVATESIAEVALSLDSDNQVEVTLWDGGLFGVRTEQRAITQVGQVADLFNKYHPEGGTPLADALKHVYKKRLKDLLKKSEPFTVVILTDGAPNDAEAVKKFFKKVINDNKLEAPGRETLAAFSFVQMGDDSGATRFLEDLDNNLIRQIQVNVDIVDTKKDNYLFGTGTYRGSNNCGPFALFWDALYD